VEAVALMKECIADSYVLIKASGGIKTKEFAEQLVNAGANRLGTSSSLVLIGK
jgi:deoxyribose-phosphate aldolase